MSAGRPRFTCPGCGKSFSWKPEIAGRKAKCTCGTSIRVPAEAPAQPAAAASPAPSPKAAPAGARPAARPPAAPKPPKVEPVEPPPRAKPVFTTSLVEEPASEEPASQQPAATPRAAATNYPGVAKRARPAQQPEKSSQIWKIILPAGLVVLLIVGLIVGRSVLKGAPKVTDKTPQKGEDTMVKQMIADQPGVEALQWLQADTNRHMVMGMTTQQAQGRIQQWYDIGAKKVYAFGGGVTQTLAIELPSAQENAIGRKKLIEWQKQWHIQYHPEVKPMEEEGQQYLLIRMKL